MPRSTQSLTNRVLDYFRSQPLETATLMLELVTDAVRERRSKSQKAKARATAPATTTSTDSPVTALTTAPAPSKAKAKAKKAKTTGPKKSHKKQQPGAPTAGESEPDLPLDDLNNPEVPDLGGDTPEGEGEAGDLETVGAGMGSVMPPPGGRR